MSEEREPWEGWTILELMGHRKLAGFLTLAEVAGAPMLRLDIPAGPSEPPATQYYSAASVYCLTPTTEEIARGLAARQRPAPVTRFELPKPAAVRPDPSRIVDVGRSPYDDDDDDETIDYAAPPDLFDDL